MFREIEYGAVKRAVSIWERKFALGADARPLGRGRMYRQPAVCVWGHFDRTGHNERYWNKFGFCSYEGMNRRFLVEINPAFMPLGREPAALVAADETGRRWILHTGRLHIPTGGRGARAAFTANTQLPGVKVRRRNGMIETCYRVADIADGAAKVQSDTARFVIECGRIRGRFEQKSKPLAAMEDAFAGLAASLAKNADGRHTRPPQESIVVDHRHDGVRDALAAILKRRNIPCTDKRISGLGPDLYTETVLFEIKTDTSIVSIQRAVGQLDIYAAVLKRPMAKVLVMPGEAPEKLRDVLRQLGIAVLTYRFAKPARFGTLEAVLREARNRI